MATWRAENSMLTKKGIEILNSIKAGEGDIVITKVVAGSGRVSESLLYNQTSISGETKLFNITSINTSSSGAELEIYIENSDFVESYDLHQIGIYVYHQIYGEQLYHISQCDADDFDTIPPIADNAVTYGYSIFMEHANSSKVTITVNPEGMVTKEEFMELEARVGSSSRNLLHNWYFFNPIDSKEGKYHNQGQSYYSDKYCNNYVGSAPSPLPVSNIEDFCSQVVIDGTTYYVKSQYLQEGYVALAGGAPVVCFNRWILMSKDAYSLASKDDRGIYLTLSKNGGAFCQNIASILDPKKYAGKQYTLTAKIEQASTGDPVIFIFNGKEYFEVSPNTAYSGYYSITGTIEEDSTDFIVGIKNNSTSNFTYVRVTAMKLEVGDKSSLDKDPPADRAEQMAICIQYDPNTDEYVGFPTSTNSIVAQATITE